MSTVKFYGYGYSDVGGRQINEDSFGVYEDNGKICAVVADGLGAHGGGKNASEIAVKNIINCVKHGRLPDETEIMYRFLQTNEEIIASRKNTYEMKTTAVMLALVKNRAIWAHIGDSRLYHFYNGRIKDYTIDHSLSQLAVSLGEITREQIPGHKERNKLLHVLGEEGEQPEICGPVELEKGFHAFLLCSDGFWEYVREEDMVLDLYRTTSAKQWIQSMQCRLTQAAAKNNDNHTAVAVYAEV